MSGALPTQVRLHTAAAQERLRISMPEMPISMCDLATAFPPPSLDEWSALVRVLADFHRVTSEVHCLKDTHEDQLQHLGSTLSDIQQLEVLNAGLRAQASGSSAGEVARAILPVPPGTTTLVVRNLPAKCCQEALLQMWPPQAFAIDYAYLPFNIKQRRQAGYAFLNFRSWEAADAFWKAWHLRDVQDGAGKSKQLQLKVASLQGLEANLRHLKSTNIEGVLNDKYLPVVFDEFQRRVNFRALIASLPSTSGLREYGPRTGMRGSVSAPGMEGRSSEVGSDTS